MTATKIQSRTVRYIEGVPYHRHIVRYTLATGQRRRMVRWSPGAHWVYEEVGRELCARFGRDGIKPGSVTISCGGAQGAIVIHKVCVITQGSGK